MQRVALLLGSVLLLGTTAAAQVRGTIGEPATEALAQAHQLCSGWFDLLTQGKTEEVAQAVTEQVSVAKSPSERIQTLNELKSSLDIILAGPPTSAYGAIDGYALLEQSYLPGTDRCFRFTFMTYHTDAPLLWEFRWYVKPNGTVVLSNVTWSGDNPFAYMSTTDMLFPGWYGR